MRDVRAPMIPNVLRIRNVPKMGCFNFLFQLKRGQGPLENGRLPSDEGEADNMALHRDASITPVRRFDVESIL